MNNDVNDLNGQQSLTNEQPSKDITAQIKIDRTKNDPLPEIIRIAVFGRTQTGKTLLLFDIVDCINKIIVKTGCNYTFLIRRHKRFSQSRSPLADFKYQRYKEIYDVKGVKLTSASKLITLREDVYQGYLQHKTKPEKAVVVEIMNIAGELFSNFQEEINIFFDFLDFLEHRKKIKIEFEEIVELLPGEMYYSVDKKSNVAVSEGDLVLRMKEKVHNIYDLLVDFAEHSGRTVKPDAVTISRIHKAFISYLFILNCTDFILCEKIAYSKGEVNLDRKVGEIMKEHFNQSTGTMQIAIDQFKEDISKLKQSSKRRRNYLVFTGIDITLNREKLKELYPKPIKLYSPQYFSLMSAIYYAFYLNLNKVTEKLNITDFHNLVCSGNTTGDIRYRASQLITALEEKLNSITGIKALHPKFESKMNWGIKKSILNRELERTIENVFNDGKDYYVITEEKSKDTFLDWVSSIIERNEYLLKNVQIVFPHLEFYENLFLCAFPVHQDLSFAKNEGISFKGLNQGQKISLGTPELVYKILLRHNIIGKFTSMPIFLRKLFDNNQC